MVYGKWRKTIAEWDLTDFVNTCATFGWRLAVGSWRLAVFSLTDDR